MLDKLKPKSEFSRNVLTLMTDATSAWAQYLIKVQNRDEVQAKLKEKDIPTAVHYPIPLCRSVLSILSIVKGTFLSLKLCRVRVCLCL